MFKVNIAFSTIDTQRWYHGYLCNAAIPNGIGRNFVALLQPGALLHGNAYLLKVVKYIVFKNSPLTLRWTLLNTIKTLLNTAMTLHCLSWHD
jgi:hypothetical protein